MDFKTLTLKSSGKLLLELRTPCRISEAYDPFVINRGAHPKLYDYTALWDTGASGSVISKKVVEKLNLKTSGKVKIYHTQGSKFVDTYLINLCLPNTMCFSLITATEGELYDFDMLIGMDIISQGDFSISNFNDKTVFSFRCPSACDIDFFNDYNNKPIKHITL